MRKGGTGQAGTGQAGTNKVEQQGELDRHYWESRYQDGKTGWDRGECHPALSKWISDKTLTPCRILVPGSGNGYEVVELARQGFDVTAIDFSPSPISRLKKELEHQHLAAHLIQDDLFKHAFPAPFDAVYEQTCLCALPVAQRAKYESTIHDLLTPGGHLYVLFMQTLRPESGPPFHCPVDEMKELFDGTRWLWNIDQGNPDQATRFEHPAGDVFELAYHLQRR